MSAFVPLVVILLCNSNPNCLCNTYSFGFLVLYGFCSLMTRQKKQTVGRRWEVKPFISCSWTLEWCKRNKEINISKIRQWTVIYCVSLLWSIVRLCRIFKGYVQHLLKLKRKGFPSHKFLSFWQDFLLFLSFALGINRMKPHVQLKIWHKPAKHFVLCSDHRLFGVNKALANWDNVSA